MARPEGLDISEMQPTKYRNPREALGGNGGGNAIRVNSAGAATPQIPVGEATERTRMQPIADPRTAYGNRFSGVAPTLPPLPVGDALLDIAAPMPQAAQSRFTAARGALNTAIPSPVVGEGAGGAVVRGLNSGMRAVSKVSPYVAGAGEGVSTVRDVIEPGMTGLDRVARVGEGAGRLGGMAAGGMAGAAGGLLWPGR